MSAKAKILIIDDDADYRASTRALLESEGYEVREATSGKRGLELARAHPPDLIVLDIMMDSLGEGYTVNQALKFSEPFRALRDTPVIMASSVEQDPESLFGWIGDTERIRPDAYMTKPLDIPLFLQRVRELLER